MEKKTIIVVYTKTKIKDSDARKLKNYAFNTKSALKVGDLIHTTKYDTPIQVVKVLDESFKYYNTNNGEMSNSYSSTAQFEIRNLEIGDEIEETIFGSLVKC